MATTEQRLDNHNDTRNISLFKTKAIAIGRIMMMKQILRENKINIIRLKQLHPNCKIPCGVLYNAHKIMLAVKSFEEARNADYCNYPSHLNKKKWIVPQYTNDMINNVNNLLKNVKINDLLLIFGYVRTYFIDKYDKNIPNSIINYCLLYHSMELKYEIRPKVIFFSK